MILTTFAVSTTIDKNRYYTKGTDEDFQEMYSFVIQHMDSFTPELILELAMNVKAHSNTADNVFQIADRFAQKGININR